MSTKMKGLLKGLRYISQIFDEKEQEIEIGNPTDVKHIAHVGCDGPSVNDAPSWMNEFSAPPKITSGNSSEAKDPSTKSSSQDSVPHNVNEMPRSRRQPSADNLSPLNSPTQQSSEARKHSRRQRSSAGTTDSGTKQSRRQHNSSTGVESSSTDQASVSKNSRRRKSKGSTGGSVSRSSRSKEQNSLNENSLNESFIENHGSGRSESVHNSKNNENHLSSVLEEHEEGKESDGIQKGIQ